tara:strand:- start:108780 stop:109931 length:1152 start_codon:yes stop_codon:yes gene_type:complete
MLLLLASIALCSCASSTPPKGQALQFWHTFNQQESVALQAWLGKSRKRRVVTTILPFAVANIRIRSALAEGACPDLLRIDSTRIPGLVDAELIREVPTPIWHQREWLQEAQDLVRYQGAAYGIPQSLDGLALIRKRNRDILWPIPSLEELEKLSVNEGPRIGMLIDGYWALAFLRAEGVTLATSGGPPDIDSPDAVRALKRFAALFHSGVAMDVLEERSPSHAMIRAFRNDDIDIAFTGPWDLPALADGNPETLQVSAFPGAYAPRGGQVLVVPKCTQNTEEAWDLALALSSPILQADWAKTLGSIPVTKDGLAGAGTLANAFYQALVGTMPMPRHVHAPELFDDLSPAVLAVVGEDATAEEALAGVNRAWRRLYHLPPEAPE